MAETFSSRFGSVALGPGGQYRLRVVWHADTGTLWFDADGDGRFAAAERRGQSPSPPPSTTAIGALLNHITGGHIELIDAGPRSFQPMNVNFGLFPPIEAPREDEKGKRLRGPEKGAARKRLLSARAEADMARWIAAM